MESSTLKIEPRCLSMEDQRRRRANCCHGVKVILWASALLLIMISVYLLIQVAIPISFETKPEQIHLSLGTNETEMVITWSTTSNVGDIAEVRFGSDPRRLHRRCIAEVQQFLPSLFMYRALLVDLKPDTEYFYQVGSNQTTWSNRYQLRTLKSGNNWLPRFAIYGDLGLVNEQSLPFLSKEVENGLYDVIFHVGDIAYDLHERNGQQGSDFMNSIEPVAARVPYMTCPGNHEQFANFSHYDARFSMIGDRHQPAYQAPLSSRLNNHFYSVDIGPVHFVVFSTEYYFFTNYGFEQIKNQYRFLEEDLKQANANRAKRPWIIALSHRPFYRPNEKNLHNQSSLERSEIRKGISGFPEDEDKIDGLRYGLEKLFFENGVDLQIAGHDHSYARLMPIYDFKLMEEKCHSEMYRYHNPKGPIHVVTGSAGCEWPSMTANPEQAEWIAQRSMDYGYTRITFKSRQHLVLEQLSDTQNGTVIDKMEITKDQDRPQWTIPTR